MWHGTPDAQVRGCEVLGRLVSHLLLDEEDNSNGESSDTDGATSTVVAKIKFGCHMCSIRIYGV